MSSSEQLLLPLSKIFKPNFKIGKEFDTFTDDLGCANTGSGYLFDCAWFDALLAGIVFGVILIVSQFLSERSKTFRKLTENERHDWVLAVANWSLSCISTMGSLHILGHNSWYLDHPGNAENNVDAYDYELNFFVPWMIGFNIGRILHVVSGLVRSLGDVTAWDMLPHALNILLYGVILDQKKFGMIAVFQMLLQSHHLYTVPLLLMDYTKHADNCCYKTVDWIGFCLKGVVLTFAGPYCMAILWYHWDSMAQFSFFTSSTFAIVIGLNTILFTGDIAFGIYWVYCQFTGQDAKKWYKDFMKRERRDRRRLRKAGYRNVRITNDPEMVSSESDETSEDEDVDLGLTKTSTGPQTELTQRKR